MKGIQEILIAKHRIENQITDLYKLSNSLLDDGGDELSAGNRVFFSTVKKSCIEILEKLCEI